jgi:hypothetical protein
MLLLTLSSIFKELYSEQKGLQETTIGKFSKGDKLTTWKCRTARKWL